QLDRRSPIKLSTTAPSAWSLTGAVSRQFPSCRRSSIRSSPFWIVIPSSFSRSKLTTLPASRRASTVFGCLLSKNLIIRPSPTGSKRRMILVLVFIFGDSLGAPPPPDNQTQQSGYQRHQGQNDP